MDDTARAALDHSQLIDLTTTGRSSGSPRRIEIFLHVADGTMFLCGQPRPEPRQWLRNIAAHPAVTVHVKRAVTGDVAANGLVITEPAERRPLIEAAARAWGRDDVELMMVQSPLVVLTV